jgi:hypothetical protein
VGSASDVQKFMEMSVQYLFEEGLAQLTLGYATVPVDLAARRLIVEKCVAMTERADVMSENNR